MSTTISNSFIAEMDTRMKLAYQQLTSKLRNTTYFKTLRGATCDFKKIAKGAASQKSRHGVVPVMNATQSTVRATANDYYAGDFADYADLEKINHDEKEVIVRTAAAALGRKADALIISALDNATATVGCAATGLTKAKILSALETLNGNDVPNDGNRFAIVGPHQWNELLNLTEFKSADYVGPQELPWLQGGTAKRWLNTLWMMHSALPLGGTTSGSNLNVGDRGVYIYHRDAIGYAEVSDIKTFVDWVPERAAWFVNALISAGAVLIDYDGVVEISCDDDAAIT